MIVVCIFIASITRSLSPFFTGDPTSTAMLGDGAGDRRAQPVKTSLALPPAVKNWVGEFFQRRFSTRGRNSRPAGREAI